MMDARSQVFDVANPHAVAAIVAAGESGDIVASDHIVDDDGVKLWARGQPVSRELQQRLLQRRLRQPLEASLGFRDGVTHAVLRRAASGVLASDHAIARTSRRWAQPLLAQVADIDLQGPVQLLLSTVRVNDPPVFEPAVRAMVLAGAMLAGQRADASELRLGLLGGLLHDLGELYIDPLYLDRSRPLTPQGYKHVAAHPRVGELLLSRLTTYPKTLAMAVGQHHERLDGSGYPGRCEGATVCRLGRLLAVVEAAAGVLSSPDVPCARASFALRAVPGEFDHAWLGWITSAVEPVKGARPDAERSDDVGAQLDALDARIGMAHVLAQGMKDDRAASDAVRRVAGHALHLLDRLRAGRNSIGLWSAADAGADDIGEIAREVRMARQELRFRLRSMERECQWAEPALAPADQALLAPLWAFLNSPLD